MFAMRKTVLLFGLVLGGLVLAGGVEANPKNPAAAAKAAKAAVKAEKHAVKAAEKNARHQVEVVLTPIVRELHGVKFLLESADHDYKGHRAAAVGKIHAAIKELGGADNVRRPGGNSEPQKLSDDQLRGAVLTLATIEKQLATVPHPRSAHAQASLAAAIKDLEVALTIR